MSPDITSFFYLGSLWNSTHCHPQHKEQHTIANVELMTDAGDNKKNTHPMTYDVFTLLAELARFYIFSISGE